MYLLYLRILFSLVVFLLVFTPLSSARGQTQPVVVRFNFADVDVKNRAFEKTLCESLSYIISSRRDFFENLENNGLAPIELLASIDRVAREIAMVKLATTLGNKGAAERFGDRLRQCDDESKAFFLHLFEIKGLELIFGGMQSKRIISRLTMETDPRVRRLIFILYATVVAAAARYADEQMLTDEFVHQFASVAKMTGYVLMGGGWFAFVHEFTKSVYQPVYLIDLGNDLRLWNEDDPRMRPTLDRCRELLTGVSY